MSSSSDFDNQDNYYSCQPKGFFTPPPTWKKKRCSPAVHCSEKKPRSSPAKADLFHVIHKVPSGDSPYVRAKHVQLVDKNPSKAVSLFWASINSGDRVDSALKDMAVVMKQLDRSDEAVEAIKSFRHLCPPESQDSLDNILVELYKQSGRVEEEIEILRIKVKQVEEGIAFGGKRTKMARSQGKKIHISVEREYSRLLGNLAWAYMQQKDFKSAEENYRKALSFESDKNKQCNLAICLMQMNKLTEAKLLLQAIRVSSVNGCIDEPYANSYERAFQMLVELESQRDLKPTFERDSGFCFQASPLPGGSKMEKRAFTEFPYEKRSDFDWRHHKKSAYGSPFCSGGGIPKDPFTQPRQCSWSFKNGDQRNVRKLAFDSSTNGPNVESLVNQSSKNMENLTHETGGWRKLFEVSKSERKKSWADEVEEYEQELETWRRDFQQQNYTEEKFNNENLDSNIITSETPDQVAKLSEKIVSIDLESGYFTQPDKTNNQSVRRSLCFDQNQKPGSEKDYCTTSPLPTKALNFEGQQSLLVNSAERRNRLKVFQDITHET
ncbi:hypothetical protein ACJIZ3_008461 [Penstemon smallii]|uniref:Uncharacterized protein n=1 Tax=Penstemon smallii TaxID=265156 RepID=A0ABD3TB19_9LAMI